MRKEILILVTYLFLSNALFAQKEYNIWYFGYRAGITFNTNPPSALTDGQMNTTESSSGICDKKGNLLFYTQGDTIWNRDHQYMKNVFSAPENYWCGSSIQGSIVIPKPGSDSLYYIFTTNGIEVYFDSLRYSVVNMKGDNNKGEVITWQKALLPNPFEGMAVAQHANQKDFWVCTLDPFSGNFNCIQTDNGEINPTVVSTPIGVGADTLLSFFKISPDNKILYANYYMSEGPQYFVLYHFDNSTGRLSDRLEIKVPANARGGAEFSHDSRFLYVWQPDISYPYSASKVIQYDLSSWDEGSITQSAFLAFDSQDLLNVVPGMQLGPDKKIYLFASYKDSLTVIDYPYKKGAACHVSGNYLPLAGRLNAYGTPYYPNFWFKSFDIELGNDTTLCEGDSLLLDSKAPPGTYVSWNTGDTGNTITVRQSGNYRVTVTNQLDTVIDSIKVTVRKKFPVYLGSDTAFCGQFLFWLKAEKNAKSYHWNTGDTSFSILVDQPGMYAVAIIDSNSCPAGDTILIDQLLAPSILLHYDSINCLYVDLDASPRQRGAHYQWSTGDTTLSIRAVQNGEYKLTISNLFCSINQTIVISNISRLCDEMTYYIPNAFTPGNDGLNEIFRVAGTNIDQVSIKIYNRWGQLIYNGAEWDGTYNGKPCQPDTYVYLITIKGYQKGREGATQVTGNVTLLR